MSESVRQALCQEADHFCYEPDVQTYGAGDRIVKTEYNAFSQFSDVGLYAEFKQAFQALLDESLNELECYPFSTKLQFNDMVLQRYTPGQLGITPHWVTTRFNFLSIHEI